MNDILHVWNLVDPKKPAPVGDVRMVAHGRGYSFSYHREWMASGYPLSGDMPLISLPIIPLDASESLGAINDSMPERWGERAIRYLDNPEQINVLDLLYLAGDGRFGALGFSKNKDFYAPHDAGPLPEIGSIELLQDMIFRIENNEPLSEREKLIASSTKSMGGAHPKALVVADGVEYIAKFPRGSNVDTGLVEHASMVLASKSGITVPETFAVQTSIGHVVMVRRFDRENERRIHCLSAKTVLTNGVNPAAHPEGVLSYPAMADFVRQSSKPSGQTKSRREIFRRMVFNILIENTDDHEKNHAFMFKDGYWEIAPAFDILPLMSNAGRQQMGVGARGSEASVQNALSQCERFGLSRKDAIEEWFSVADQVSQWKKVFETEGVTKTDIEYIKGFIDFGDRLKMRDRNAHRNLFADAW